MARRRFGACGSNVAIRRGAIGDIMTSTDFTDIPTEPREKPIFEVFTSRGFEAWLAASHASLAFTTYQVGKIFFLGLKPDGKFWVFNRDIGRCLGLAVSGPELWVTSEGQIYRYRDAMA